MSKKFIGFGSIKHFDQITKDIRHTAQYVGLDEEGNVLVNRSAIMPVIECVGYEKIHGSSSSVCYNNTDGFWVQSRKHIITPQKDNAGCALVYYELKDIWIKLMLQLACKHSINLDTHTISLFSEWCGGNIQHKTCVSKLSKKSIIFSHFKVSPIDSEDDESSVWLNTGGVSSHEHLIFNVSDFKQQSITIDFNQPKLANSKIIEMIEEIEKSSPIGEYFGIEGNTGEGYVWEFRWKDTFFRFKTKGEEHSKCSKVRTLKPTDEAFENKKIKFVNEVACTQSRLEQMYTEIIHSTYNGDELLMSNKDIGTYLKLIMHDIIKEESDKLLLNELDMKDINRYVAQLSKEFFFGKLKDV